MSCCSCNQSCMSFSAAGGSGAGHRPVTANRSCGNVSRPCSRGTTIAAVSTSGKQDSGDSHGFQPLLPSTAGPRGSNDGGAVSTGLAAADVLVAGREADAAPAAGGASAVPASAASSTPDAVAFGALATPTTPTASLAAPSAAAGATGPSKRRLPRSCCTSRSSSRPPPAPAPPCCRDWNSTKHPATNSITSATPAKTLRAMLIVQPNPWVASHSTQRVYRLELTR